MTAPVFRVCLLGAESTGKTSLAQALAAALTRRGVAVALVPEVLREWCEYERRTPRAEEQLAIATEQARRVDAAANEIAASAVGGVVISDTGPLMVAVYSEMLFGDTSLYDMALAHLRGFDLVLLTGLDIPWVADGLQRDGPHVREPVDALVRAALVGGGIVWRGVYGQGEARLAAALRALDAVREPARNESKAGPRATWVWTCDKCSDPECEHRLFTSLTGAQAPESN